MAAAEAEAGKNNWAVVITIIDSGGNIVMLHRSDDVQLSSIASAQGKAGTALCSSGPRNSWTTRSPAAAPACASSG